MSETQTDATQTLADTKTEIQKLEDDAKAGVKTVVNNVEAAAQNFYERHLPAFAGIAGAVIGAIAMLVWIKLL